MGRPKGLPKTGGRKPGTPNRNSAATRERIEGDADPVGFLIRVMHGETIDGSVPTLDHRLQVASRLLDKIVPDIKACTVTGTVGGSGEVLPQMEPGQVLASLARRLEKMAWRVAPPSVPSSTGE